MDVPPDGRALVFRVDAAPDGHAVGSALKYKPAGV